MSDDEPVPILNPGLYAFVGESAGAEERGWRQLPRQSSGSGFVELEPGETVDWQLSELDQFRDADRRPRPGTYVFRIDVPDPGTEADWTACLASFRLVEA